MIRALKQVERIDNRSRATSVLNQVTAYLRYQLEDVVQRRAPQFLDEPGDLIQKIRDWVDYGSQIHEEISVLSSNQQKELIALGFFLQGKFSAVEEFEFLQKALQRYQMRIDEFRGFDSQLNH